MLKHVTISTIKINNNNNPPPKKKYGVNIGSLFSTFLIQKIYFTTQTFTIFQLSFLKLLHYLGVKRPSRPSMHCLLLINFWLSSEIDKFSLPPCSGVTLIWLGGKLIKQLNRIIQYICFIISVNITKLQLLGEQIKHRYL